MWKKLLYNLLYLKDFSGAIFGNKILLIIKEIDRHGVLAQKTKHIKVSLKNLMFWFAY